MKHYAGLDLSMETTQVCIVDENGQKLVSEKVESTSEALAAMLERYRPLERTVIETGRMSPAICLGLRELGVPVVCIDARQAHQNLKAMKANKTDRRPRTVGPPRLLQGGARQISDGAWRAQRDHRTQPSGGSACPARQYDPRSLRHVWLSPRCGPRKAFLERIMRAAHIPGLGDAIRITAVRARCECWS
jgi:hypothetical protein